MVCFANAAALAGSDIDRAVRATAVGARDVHCLQRCCAETQQRVVIGVRGHDGPEVGSLEGIRILHRPHVDAIQDVVEVIE